jgi:zinc transport system substrate-binding protein
MFRFNRVDMRAYRCGPTLLAVAFAATSLAACTSDKVDSTKAPTSEIASTVGEAGSAPETSAVESSGGGATETTVGSLVLPNGAATKVVASTTWVASIAKLAGATDIKVIVPSDVASPADYEPTAADLEKLKGAEWVIFEGTEKVAKIMADSAKPPTRIDVVSVHHDPATLAAEVGDFGALLSTTDAAAANLASYNQSYKEVADELKGKLSSLSSLVIAQESVSGWATLAGWSVDETFGPKPPSAAAITNLAALGPTVVLEDGHLPLGKPLADASGAKLISLFNYPGDDLDIMALVRKNADTIAAAMAG